MEAVKPERWSNPYMALVETMPEYIVGLGPEDGLTPEELIAVRARVAGAPRLLIELCSGSGHHLLELGRRNPDAFLAGFELRYKRAFRTAEKARDAGLTNVMVFKTRAEHISEYFTAQSVDGIYINFPDPWSKKRRWSKHRLLKSEYLEALAALLKPGGFFAYKTDHRECFEEVLAEVRRQGRLSISRLTFDLRNSEFATENIDTEFERLFVSQAKPIHYLLAHKA